MKREDKKKVMDNLHERLLRASFAVITDFRGMDVETMGELRKGLRAESVEYQVVKNKLIQQASEGTGVYAIKGQFKGPCAVAICYGDPVGAAKVLTKFATGRENFAIKVGALQGRVLSAAQIDALSKMPSREVLLAQALSTMNAVPTGLVRALSDVPRRLLNVLTAIREQKEAA